MQRKLLTPSRLAAATALALAGLIAGPSVASASDCVGYKLYVYGNNQGPIVGDTNKHCVVPTGWKDAVSVEDDFCPNTWLLPPGTPTGGGFGVWVPGP